MFVAIVSQIINSIFYFKTQPVLALFASFLGACAYNSSKLLTYTPYLLGKWEKSQSHLCCHIANTVEHCSLSLLLLQKSSLVSPLLKWTPLISIVWKLEACRDCFFLCSLANHSFAALLVGISCRNRPLSLKCVRILVESPPENLGKKLYFICIFNST